MGELWVVQGLKGGFPSVKCSVMSGLHRWVKTHTLFPYLWQESKLNTNQYFVWFGEISLKITFVRALNHRQEAEEAVNRGAPVIWWRQPIIVQSAYLIWERGHKNGDRWQYCMRDPATNKVICSRQEKQKKYLWGRSIKLCLWEFYAPRPITICVQWTLVLINSSSFVINKYWSTLPQP